MIAVVVSDTPSENLSFIDYTHTYWLPGFAPVPALAGVSLTNIEPGEIICILGPNGAGKTTLLSAIAGLVHRRGERGTIIRNGAAVPRAELRIAYIPQKPHDGLCFDLSIVENVVLRRLAFEGARLSRAVTESMRGELIELLSEFGFEFLISRMDMPPSALSGGEQQLLNVAASIFAGADLLVSDEPTSKLDESNRIRVCQAFLDMTRSRRIRMLMSTHDFALAQQIGDRLVFLSEGRLERQERIREPRTTRALPRIHKVSDMSRLPWAASEIDKDWWKPGRGRLFAEAYSRGDASDVGFLAHSPLTQAERTIREVDGLLAISEIGTRQNTCILDLPCGWGRHTIELGRRGFKVIGIDYSDDYIGHARSATAEIPGLNVKYIRADMRAVPLHSNSIDLVANLWSSFGFFSNEENEAVLGEFCRIMKPGGLLLIHSDLNPKRIKHGIFDEPRVRSLCDGGTLNVDEYYCEADSYVYGRWNVTSLDEVHYYRIRVYDLEEWHALADRCGLTVMAVLGQLEPAARSLVPDSQEFVIVLRKM